jgi:hypothetical protein
MLMRTTSRMVNRLDIISMSRPIVVDRLQADGKTVFPTTCWAHESVLNRDRLFNAVSGAVLRCYLCI